MEFDIQAMVNGALAKSKKTVKNMDDLATALKEVYSAAEAEYKAQKAKNETERLKTEKIQNVADALAENVNELFALMWPDCDDAHPITGKVVIDAMNDIKEMMDTWKKIANPGEKRTKACLDDTANTESVSNDEEDIFDFLADLFD